MECPNCHHQSQSTVSITCSNCKHTYERGLIEEYEHVRYVMEWLAQHRVQVGSSTETLLAELGSRKTSLRAQMHIVDVKPIVTPMPAPAQPKPIISPAPAPTAAPPARPMEAPVLSKPAPTAQPAPAMVASISTPVATSRPLAASMPASISLPAAPKPVALPTKPAAPPKPPKPPINWNKLWDNGMNFVTSGAWLNALLYLGAFILVVASVVLVATFWNIFPPVLQALFIFGLPSFFYALGWLIRTRLKLEQTGIVITGVGALLLLVSFIGVYQLQSFHFDLNLYWLVASLFTTAIYVFTAARLKSDFFGYLSLLAGVNVLLSLTRVLNASMEWTVAMVPAAGLVMTGLAGSLWPRGEAWRETARPARYLPQVLTPIALIVILFAGGTGSEAGKMTAFLCAATAYGLLAWKFPSVWQLVLSLAGLMAAVFFGVRLFDTSNLWLPTAGALLAAGYILTGWRFFIKEHTRRDYRLAFYAAGLVLSLAVFATDLALLVTSGNRLEAVIPLSILALSFCLWNLLLRQPLHGFAGGELLAFAFWLWLDIAHIQLDYYSLAFLLLISFAYLPASLLMERVDKKLAEPFKILGWLGSAVVFYLSFSFYRPDTGWISALTLTLLSVYYAFNASYFGESGFALTTALVFGLAAMLWTWFWKLPIEQSALVWPVLAFGYMFTERLLGRLKENAWHKPALRLPLKLGVIVLAAAGLITSLVGFAQLYSNSALAALTLIPQALLILLTILAARLYRSQWPLFVEPPLAALLANLFFNIFAPSLLGHPLEWYEYGLVLCGAAWLHLLAAAGLDSLKTRYSHGLYLGSYGLAVLSIFWTILNPDSLLWTLGAFILAMLFSAVLVDFKRHFSWAEFTGIFGAAQSMTARLVRDAFLWLAAWLFPIWCSLLLAQLAIPFIYRWLALSLPALLYLLIGQRLSRRQASYAWPFFSAAHLYTLIAVSFNLIYLWTPSNPIIWGLNKPGSYNDNSTLFTGVGLIQLCGVLFYSAWAWLKGQEFFAHVTAWLSILPISALLFILQIFTPGQVVMLWSGWAGILLLVGFLLDRAPKSSPRFAHGPYLAGYALSSGLLLISLQAPWLNINVLGIYLGYAVLSAAAVHFKQHRSWDDFAGMFGKDGSTVVRVIRGAFLWVAAWLFPLWCAQILIQLNIPYTYRWLALAVPALIYLALGQWLSKREATYAWPFFSAAHVYTLTALLFSAGDLLAAAGQTIFGLSTPLFVPTYREIFTGQGLVLLSAVLFYGAWARMKGQLIFAHICAWLSILPFTALLFVLQTFSPQGIVIAWGAWAGILLLAGFVLDRAPKGSPRFAHGAYLAGYALALICLVTTFQDLWLSIVLLGMCIVFAALSAAALNFGYHQTWEDFINFFWRKETLMRRGARLLCLFFAVYALPVWVFLLEKQSLANLAGLYAVQGVSLALMAPLLIAAGLYLRRFNPDYTWPFYSAGYTLTALGAMLAADDQRLAIYVLILDIVVYAVSSVIFRQAFWLYLATCLTPITALMLLNYNHNLVNPAIAWTFMGITYAYFTAGQLLDRQQAKTPAVAAFAMPFYFPAYVLSALSLALASGDAHLALGIFPASILLYALSAWRFREPLFVYPAAWLSVVPYSLAISLYTAIPPLWVGLAWLPLIVIYIILGRFVFRRAPFDITSPRAIFHSLNQSNAPFYLMAYALSLSMVFTSQANPLTFTLACSAAMLLYLGSALLFRHPAWIYPTLLFAHLSLLAYFTIHPSDAPARMIAIPFMALTWIEALVGYFISRHYKVAEMAANGRMVFKLFGKQLDFGSLPSLGFLSLPSWAQPIFIVVAIDTFVWEGLALTGLDTGLWVSAGFCLLFALLATLWQDSFLTYLALGLGSLAFSSQLGQMGYNVLHTFAGLTGLGLGLYLFSWLADGLKGVLSVWRRPLVNIAVALSALGLVVTLPLVFADSIPASLALVLSGALYMSMSLRQRTTLLGYLGVGLLLAGWSLFLFKQNVREPQYYAIPIGLYFIVIGFFERRRHPGRFALIVEGLGLALILVTSLTQSINNGTAGLPYFILLLVEGVLSIGWGAYHHLRVPYMVGLIAVVVNVLAQVVLQVSIHQINQWFILFGVGFISLGVAIFGNWRREQLRTRGQEFREMLESWN